jgi:hypothetical protein
MTAPSCLACTSPLSDPPSLKERLCADCAYDLSLLPAEMQAERMARLRAKGGGA